MRRSHSNQKVVCIFFRQVRFLFSLQALPRSGQLLTHALSLPNTCRPRLSLLHRECWSQLQGPRSPAGSTVSSSTQENTFLAHRRVPFSPSPRCLLHPCTLPPLPAGLASFRSA